MYIGRVVHVVTYESQNYVGGTTNVRCALNLKTPCTLNYNRYPAVDVPTPDNPLILIRNLMSYTHVKYVCHIGIIKMGCQTECEDP